MKRLNLLLAFCLALGFAAPGIAQSDSCTPLIRNTLATVDRDCRDTDRNQACYGHLLLDVVTRAPGMRFERTGDIVDLAQIESLTTYALDETAGTWGVALLRVQANLPDSLPGQNATFVLFGATTLKNEVSAALSDAPTLSAFAARRINVRSGPGTNFTVLGALEANVEITLKGRNAAGDWAQIVFEGQPAWVFGELLTVDGPLMDLAVVEAGAVYSAPMQALRFSSGTGPSTCSAAPADGLVIQSPSGLRVDFLINGIEVSVGSTAVLRTPRPNVLRVLNIEGTVRLRSGGVTVTLLPGQAVNVREGEAPGTVEVYDLSEGRNLPLGLLPEVVSVAPVIYAIDTYDVIGDGERNPFPITFGNGDGDAITGIQQTLVRASSGTWASGLIEIDESRYDDPFGGELYYYMRCNATRAMTITYDIALVDAAGNSSPPYRYTITCSPP